MEILYNVDALSNILYDISELTGITMSFYDYNNEHIADSLHGSLYCINIHTICGMQKCHDTGAALMKKCRESLKYEECTCFMGLYEAALPIIKDDIFVGNISLAGIRTKDSFRSTILGENEAMELFLTQPYYTQNQINALKNILPKILFNNAITFVCNDTLEQITLYIKNNLHEKLTINSLCKKFHISKNSLYSMFRNDYNMTINEYLVQARIDKAKKLLSSGISGEKLIGEIGIDNYSYFCRLFKEKTKMTPSKFKNIHRR